MRSCVLFEVKYVTRYWRNRLYLSFRTFTITKSMHILIWFGEYLIVSSFKWVVVVVVVVGSSCFRALPDYTKNRGNEKSDDLPGKPDLV